MYRIGVDVGGTFTDFTLFDEESGLLHYFKTGSTPDDPSEAIRQGLQGLLDAHGVDPRGVTHLGHGTTVATNMVIEQRGSKTGLITTKGFRDVLEIGRQLRPHLYDYTVGKPVPLVAREHRLEIHERMTAAGETLVPLDDTELEAAVGKLKAQEVTAVAVCFLHAYRSPEHERRARAVLERLLPDAYVSLSSEILPEFREFERLSTTVLNAYVGPRMARYLERFLTRVDELGITVEPSTIHSNGGLMSIGAVRETPVKTCLSGPAAGVVGAAEVGAAAGFPNLVTFDVGGTSTDVSLVHDAKPLFTNTRLVAGYPLKTPMIDIHVIGAGGGSIAWLDDAGALKVGPHSAGADPGPVAYGRGGQEVTLTDVNICLHRLDPKVLLGGRMQVDEAGARAAIEERIAQPLGLAFETAAHGVIQIANANMARAIRSVSTERGHDLGGFALFAYGGAGPLHAAEIAQECGIPHVVVPQEPGTMCARGILLSDVTTDLVRSEISVADEATWVRVCDHFGEMIEAGHHWLEREQVAPAYRSFVCAIEARYRGQNFEVCVLMEPPRPDGLDAFLDDFHSCHRQEHGYAIDSRLIEIVNCRVQARGRLAKAQMPPLETGGTIDQAVVGEREVYFGAGHGWCPTRIHTREELPVDQPFDGPAILVEMSSTTVVLPEQTVRLDPGGNLIIDIAPIRRA